MLIYLMFVRMRLSVGKNIKLFSASIGKNVMLSRVGKNIMLFSVGKNIMLCYSLCSREFTVT